MPELNKGVPNGDSNDSVKARPQVIRKHHWAISYQGGIFGNQSFQLVTDERDITKASEAAQKALMEISRERKSNPIILSITYIDTIWE